jgi:hypothetical protein
MSRLKGMRIARRCCTGFHPVDLPKADVRGVMIDVYDRDAVKQVGVVRRTKASEVAAVQADDEVERGSQVCPTFELCVRLGVRDFLPTG